jgi:hypothetical protein
MQLESRLDFSTSWKRVIGASLFGFMSASYIQLAAVETVPRLMMTQGTDMESAEAYFESSGLIRSEVFFAAALVAALAAGFLARQRGMLAGVLTICPYIWLLGYTMFTGLPEEVNPLVADLLPNTTYKPGAVLQFVFLLLASLLGGHIGQRFYSPDVDPDLAQAKLTILGVRWPHYLWIFPFVFLAFFCSIIAIIFSAVKVFTADVSFIWHASLWFNVFWWIFLVVGTPLVGAAANITAVGFIRFYEVMQYGQTRFKGWRKAGRILLYGVAAPALSYAIAALAAIVAHSMPRPSQGDWKIELGLATFVAIITATIWIHSRIIKPRGL